MKRFSISLYYKALLAIIAILLPLFITFLIGYNRNKQHLVRHALDDLTVIAEAYEGRVYQFLEMSKRRAQDFASDGYIREQTQKIILGRTSEVGPLGDHLVRNKMSLDKTIHAIRVVSLDGRVVASTDASSIGMDVSGAPFFISGRKAASVTESDAGFRGLPELVISTPLSNRVTGEPIGVIANFIMLSELNRVLSGEFVMELGALTWGKGRHKTMEAYLVNEEKLIITESIFVDDAVLRQPVDTEPVNACLRSNREITGLYENYLGTEVMGASMCIPSLKWTLAVEVGAGEVLSPIKEMRRDALLTTGIVGGLIGLLFILFNRNIVRPVSRVSAAAREIALGNYDITIPVKSRDEIGALARIFNSMAQEVKTTTAAYRESESRLADAQRIAHIGNWEWDIERNKLQWYYEVYRIFGVRPHEFDASYDSFLEFVHADDREYVKRAVEGALNEKKPYSIDHRIVLPDGREKTVHEEAEVYFNDEGRAVRMVGTVQDITGRKEAEDALRRSESSLAEAQRIARMGNWDWDIITDDLFWSDEIYKIFGLDRDRFELNYRSFIGCVHPDDREYVRGITGAAIKEKRPYEIEHRILRPDGKVRIVQERATVQFNEAGKAVRMVGTVQDITEQKQTEFELKKLSTAMDQSVNIVFMTDVHGKIEYVNDRFEEITGYSREEAIGQNPRILASGETTREEYREFWKTILSGKTWRGIFRNRKKNGELYWSDGMVTPIRNERGDITHFLAVQEDMTERMKAEERIEYLATYDELTELLNRGSFMEKITEWLTYAGSSKKAGALLLIDLDQFKLINDTYGHNTGDELLRHVAGFIQEVIKEDDKAWKEGDKGIACRLGADEFSVFLPARHKEVGVKIAENIRKRLEEFRLGDTQIRSTASIGIVFYPDHGVKLKELLAKTDAAMYRAKAMGRNRCHIYSPEDRDLEDMQRKVAWKGRIQDALKEDRFDIWFQPILALEGGIDHYEVLARMRDREGNVILPGSFIDMAETFGLIGSIDRVIAEKAMKFQAKMRRQGKHFTFSMNLSGKDLVDEDLLAFLRSKIDETGADPSHLVFEITETAAVHDLERAKRFVNELKSLGCKFSLDDFGVGFTSFVYLREMRVDYIKIDGSFIRRLHENKNDQLVVKAIVDVARGMGIKTVAEFVESEEILKHLRAFGVDYAQGYYVGKPAPELK